MQRYTQAANFYNSLKNQLHTSTSRKCDRQLNAVYSLVKKKA